MFLLQKKTCFESVGDKIPILPTIELNFEQNVREHTLNMCAKISELGVYSFKFSRYGDFLLCTIKRLAHFELQS